MALTCGMDTAARHQAPPPSASLTLEGKEIAKSRYSVPGEEQRAMNKARIAREAAK